MQYREVDNVIDIQETHVSGACTELIEKQTSIPLGAVKVVVKEASFLLLWTKPHMIIKVKP